MTMEFVIKSPVSKGLKDIYLMSDTYYTQRANIIYYYLSL